MQMRSVKTRHIIVTVFYDLQGIDRQTGRQTYMHVKSYHVNTWNAIPWWKRHLMSPIGSELPTLDEMMKVDLFMHSVRTAFEDAHLQTYLAKRSQIRYELDNMEAESEGSDLLTVKAFKEFGTIVDQLRDQLFPLARPRKLVAEIDMRFIQAWNIDERVKEELIFAFEQIR